MSSPRVHVAEPFEACLMYICIHPGPFLGNLPPCSHQTALYCQVRVNSGDYSHSLISSLLGRESDRVRVLCSGELSCISGSSSLLPLSVNAAQRLLSMTRPSCWGDALTLATADIPSLRELSSDTELCQTQSFAETERTDLHSFESRSHKVQANSELNM